MAHDASPLDELLPLVVLDDDGESLLPADATWADLWRDMPSYEMGDTSAVQKILVHFRSRGDVEEFARLLGDMAWTNGVGSKITERTDSMWFGRDPDFLAPSEVIWTSDRTWTPRHPIYIPSVGRWDDPRTALALDAIDVPYRVVVEPAQRDEYARALGEEKLLVLPEDFSRRNTGSIPARNWIWDHAVSEGHERHWVIDDNVRGFLRTHRNRRIPVDTGAIFCAVEDFADRYTNVALAGLQYMYFVNERSETQPPIYLNTRVYSMILVDHALPHRWRGRYNEDTDLSLRALEDGLCTVLFNTFLGDKAPTLTMRGGNTDTVYATGDNRRAFAESLAEQHPDVARVVWRYGRWHHEVDYRPFANNRLVERPGWRPPADPEYGMRLVRRDPTSRYPRPAVRPAEPVVLVPKPTSTRVDLTQPQNPPRDLFDLFDDDAPPNAARNCVDASVAPELITARAEDESHAPAVAHTFFDAGPVVLTPRAVQPEVARQTVVITPRGAGPAPVAFAAPTREVHVDPFLAHHAKRLRLAGNARLAFDEATWWNDPVASAVGFDCEVYPNFFVVCFKRFSDGARLAFEKSERQPVLDVDGLQAVLRSNVVVSFNGNGYDLYILAAALEGADNQTLFELSQSIIVRNERPPGRPFEPPLNHVDLMGALPQGRRSLKEIHGRLHGRFIVDLPYPPNTELTPRQMNVATLYCFNDVDAVEGLRQALHGPLMMRHEMGERYGIDLRSKSDAQMGEEIFRARMGRSPGRGEPVRSVGYTPPPFLKFSGETQRGVLQRLSEETFRVDGGGHVILPDWLEGTVVRIGETDYGMGVGGIHSQEANRALRSNAERFLLDVDVGSQYPNIALGLGLYPAAVGPEFSTIFGDMVKERLEAKAAGDRVVSEGLKIACNGSGFGKTGSQYSFLYAPHLFLGITLTGQLSLLMLIERAEMAEVPVVSANTDGVVFYCPRARDAVLDEVLAGWEIDVGMALERTRYDALYSSSVNCYIALKEGGGAKRKGWIANPWAEGDLRGMLSKNPQMTVLSDAAVALLAEGVPVEETIAAASDPRAFVTLIKVAGGASWRGQPLGRAVRWYWSTDGEAIVYTDNGRRVAKTEGAAPLMEMTDRAPADLDRDKYIQEAHRLLVDIGAEREPGLL